MRIEKWPNFRQDSTAWFFLLGCTFSLFSIQSSAYTDDAPKSLVLCQRVDEHRDLEALDSASFFLFVKEAPPPVSRPSARQFEVKEVVGLSDTWITGDRVLLSRSSIPSRLRSPTLLLWGHDGAVHPPTPCDEEQWKHVRLIAQMITSGDLKASHKLTREEAIALLECLEMSSSGVTYGLRVQGQLVIAYWAELVDSKLGLGVWLRSIDVIPEVRIAERVKRQRPVTLPLDDVYFTLLALRGDADATRYITEWLDNWDFANSAGVSPRRVFAGYLAAHPRSATHYLRGLFRNSARVENRIKILSALSAIEEVRVELPGKFDRDSCRDLLLLLTKDETLAAEAIRGLSRMDAWECLDAIAHLVQPSSKTVTRMAAIRYLHDCKNAEGDNHQLSEYSLRSGEILDRLRVTDKKLVDRSLLFTADPGH